MDSIFFGHHKGVLIQTSKTTERFFMAEYRYFEPVTGVDAEIEAINIVTDIRQAHIEIGIEKEYQAYKYMKLAVMEKIEKGIRMTDKHEFECKIYLN